MDDFKNKKLAELVLYILNKTDGADYYHIFKILYFAEMSHVAKWGVSFVPDEFYALEHGPVPTNLYDAIKDMHYSSSKLSRILSEVAEFGKEDARYVLFPKRATDMTYLSASEVSELDESIAENESLSFNRLKAKSHDKAWSEAYRKANGTSRISLVTMAEVYGADGAMLDYIKDQLLVESALLQ